MKKHINFWLVMFLALSLALPIYSMAGNLLNIFTTDGYYVGIPYKSLFVDEAGNVTAMTNGTKADLGTDLSEPVITISNFSPGVTGDNSTAIVTGTKSNPLTFYVVATDSAGTQSLQCLFPPGAFTLKGDSVSEGTFQKTYDTAGTYYATFEASATESSKTYYTQRMIKINITDPQVQQYAVTTSVYPSGAGTVSGAGTYAAGASVTVNASPASNYAFNNWTEGATPVSTSASYQFTMPSNNRTLVANFTPVTSPQFAVYTSVNPAGAGTVSGAGTYNVGASVTVSATANSGWTFNSWTEGVSPASTSASYQFTMPSYNRNLVANFTSSTPPSSCTPPQNAQPLNLDFRYVMSFSPGETVFSVSVTASQIRSITGQILGLSGGTEVVWTWIMPDCRTFTGHTMGTDNAVMLDIRSRNSFQPNINYDYVPTGNHTFKIMANAPSNVIIWFTTY